MSTEARPLSADLLSEGKPSFLEVCFFNLIVICTDKRSSFSRACLFLFIVLCPIQDFVLQATFLRGLGASPAIFPLFGLAFVAGTRWLLSAKMKVSLGVIICIAYVLMTSIYGLLLFGIRSQGEDLIWKSVTSLISLLVVIFAVTLDYDQTALVRKAIFVAFALVILGFMFGNSNPFGLPGAVENGVLHFTPLPDVRPRGLANEPSVFSITVIALGLLAVHVARSRAGKIFLFLLTLGLLVASGSKGGILTIFICVVLLGIIKWRSKWYYAAALLLAMLPVGLFLTSVIPDIAPEDLVTLSGTVATRFSMVICALVTVIRNPLGVGLTGFLPAVKQYLPGAMSTLQSILPVPLDFSEVSDYITSAEMVSTKSFFFDQFMRFGIPFAWLFFAFIGRVLKRLADRKETVLLVAVLACAIAVTTYISGAGTFAVSIVFGVALKEVRVGSNSYRRQ